MLKRKLILQLLTISCLCIGCTSKSVHNVEDIPYILFATPLQEHPIWLRAKDGFMDACTKENYHCDWIGPTTIDIGSMEEVIETGILQKADAIITQGVVSPTLLEKARKANIAIMLVDSDMEDSYRSAYFGKDFHEQANLFLNDIEQTYGKDTKLEIAIQVAELEFDIAKEQIKEIEETFASHPGGVEVVAVSESKSDQVRAKKEWATVLSANPNVNVAISLAGESVESCYEAALSLGIHEQMLIYGVDDVASTMQLLRDGKIAGSIVVPFYDYGYETVLYFTRILNGEVQEANVELASDIQLLTPGSVTSYEDAYD